MSKEIKYKRSERKSDGKYVQKNREEWRAHRKKGTAGNAGNAGNAENAENAENAGNAGNA